MNKKSLREGSNLEGGVYRTFRNTDLRSTQPHLYVLDGLLQLGHLCLHLLWGPRDKCQHSLEVSLPECQIISKKIDAWISKTALFHFTLLAALQFSLMHSSHQVWCLALTWSSQLLVKILQPHYIIFKQWSLRQVYNIASIQMQWSREVWSIHCKCKVPLSERKNICRKYAVGIKLSENKLSKNMLSAEKIICWCQSVDF